MTMWTYTLKGYDGRSVEFSVTGQIAADRFDEAIEVARAHAFRELTQGNAVFGKPGQGGCKGPYQFTELAIKAHIYRSRITT